MKKIDWVKIPEGEFTPAFSQQQMEHIREKAYQQMVNIDSWSSEERFTLDEFLTKVRTYWKMLEIDPLNSNSKWPYSGGTPDEILALKRKHRELEYILAIEMELTRMEAFTETSESGRAKRFVTAKPTTVKSFYMARFPITETECQLFFDKHPLDKKQERFVTRYGPNRPISLEWEIAKQFCEWIEGRLPTALEWEYATRGPESLFYPWGNEWDPLRGNFYSTYDIAVRPEHLDNHAVTPIDGYPDGVSPFGIWDMVGNLAEWVASGRHKGQTYRERHDPAWFYFMPVFINDADPLPGYIGFRPVKDEWEPQLWSGFGAAASEKAFSRVWDNDEDAVYDDL